MERPGANLQPASGESAEEPTPPKADITRPQHHQGEEQPRLLPGQPTSLPERGGGGAARDSSTEGEQGPAPKRMRTGDLPTHAVSTLPPFLTAFPVPGGPVHAVNHNLVGAAVKGTIDAATDSAYFVTLTLPTGQEFKGALVSPPASFLGAPAAGAAAGAAAQAAPIPHAGAPLKKPRTAFNFYSDAVRPGAKEKHPRADQKTISKVVGELWAQLPAEERAPYNEMARQDRERYEQELQDYQRNFPQGPRRDLQRHQRPSALLEQQEQQPGSGRARPASGGAQHWQAVPQLQPDLQAPPVMMPPLRQVASSLPSRAAWASAGMGDMAPDFGRAEAGSRDASSQPSATGGSSSLQAPPPQQHQPLAMPPWPQHALPRGAPSQGSLPAARAAGVPPLPGPSLQLATLQALLQSMAAEPREQQQQQQDRHPSSALAPAIAALLQRQQQQQQQQPSSPPTLALPYDLGMPTTSQAANLPSSVQVQPPPAGLTSEPSSLINQLINFLQQQDPQPSSLPSEPAAGRSL